MYPVKGKTWWASIDTLTHSLQISQIEQSDQFSYQPEWFFLNFLVFSFWLNVVKRSWNKMLNSWRKQKLSTNIKLNQQHCNLIWKSTFSSGLVTSSELLPRLLYFAFFILFLEMWHFSDKMSLKLSLKMSLKFW